MSHLHFRLAVTACSLLLIALAGCRVDSPAPAPTRGEPVPAATPTPTPQPLTATRPAAPTVTLPPGVWVETDRREYRPGDTVLIRLTNSTGGPVYYYTTGSFWRLERRQEDAWKYVYITLPEDNRCAMIMVELQGPIEIPAGQRLEDSLVLDALCEWPQDAVGVPTLVPQPLPPGEYRIAADTYPGRSRDLPRQLWASAPFRLLP